MMRYFLILSAMVAASMGAVAHAEPLGRLFTAPEERAKLDQLRKLGPHAPMAADQPAAKLAAEPVPDRMTLDGYVTRSSGKSTAWVNQIPHSENDPANTANSVIVLQRPSRPPLIYLRAQSGRRISVKVGETLDTHTGKVRDAYEPEPVNTPAVKTDNKP